MTATKEMRLNALMRLNGAGRLARLHDQLEHLATDQLTDEQALMLDQILTTINELAVRERDEAVALMGEATA
jgi:hypothetical protein